MFTHILVPIDGSSTANQAIQKAAAVAKAFNAKVTVVCIIDTYAFTGVGTEFAYGQDEYLKAATKEAHDAIEAARSQFAANGTAASASVLEGQAVYKSILEAAETAGADLIVMGSHGRKGLQKLVLGSVAAQVLSHTHLPVMIVRE
ncbi:MAG: universal stress protein [Pseudomonadota bacterium]